MKMIMATDKEKKEFQKGVEQERKQLLKLLLKKTKSKLRRVNRT
jgi:hypothetical protein